MRPAYGRTWRRRPCCAWHGSVLGVLPPCPCVLVFVVLVFGCAEEKEAAAALEKVQGQLQDRLGASSLREAMRAIGR